MVFSTATLVLVARQILIYAGLSMILIGMFGSLMIILIFSQNPFNQNPCSIYMIVNGTLSFLFLPLYYLPNILVFGFQINVLALNTPFCKFQMSYAIFTVTSSFIINCFISFDRYAISSRSARIRSFSSKKNSLYLVIIGLASAGCFIGLPVAILFENVPLGPNGSYLCTSKSTMFLLIAALVYYPILEGVLPIVLAIYFWYLTRKHIHTLNNQKFMRRFDRHITRMFLFQVITNAIASVPFATINLYRSLTIQVIRSEDQENIVQFFRLMAICLFYIQYCTDFYIYMITSSEIRRQAKRLLCFWNPRWADRTIKSTLKPEWYQSFMYDTTLSELPPLELAVFDDTSGTEDLIGR
ncbi:unnamed protein product [Rotaria sp. Silwood1]|nr:unnamed protein product [Rotaria sp. Silwood1]